MLEQSSSQSMEDTAPRSSQMDSSPRHEPMSFDVLSQTEFMSDAGASSSEDQEIATQMPRKKGSLSKSHHIEGGGVVTEDILNVLESFHERKAAVKRPSSTSEEPLVQERFSKKRHLGHSSKNGQSPTAQSDVLGFLPFGDDSALAENAKENAILDDTLDPESPVPTALSLTNQVHKSKDAEIRQTGGLPHNKALSDHFHIGLKLLPKKFVSPPKSQQQYLTHQARYKNPKLPDKKQCVAFSPSVLQALRTLSATAETFVESASEEAPEQMLEHDGKEMGHSKSAGSYVIVMNPPQSQQLALPTKSYRGLRETTQHGDYAELSNAEDDAISWASSPVRPVRCQEDHANSNQLLHEPSLHKSGSTSVASQKDDEKAQSPPPRLPSLKAISTSHVGPAASTSRNFILMNQVSSSSPGIEDELEQQVPVALYSSAVNPYVSIESPPPTSRTMPQSSPKSPVVQIGRSPYSDSISKDAKISLLRAAISKGASSTGTRETRAVSSDPIIPATCTDSQETVVSETGSQDPAFQAVSSSARSGTTHCILVPATIPARAANTLRVRMQNISQPDMSVIPATLGRIGPTSSFVLPHSESASHNQENRHGSVSVADGDGPKALKSKMDVINIPANGPSRCKTEMLTPHFSQLSSTADTANNVIANGEFLLAQPDEHGGAEGHEAAQMRSTSANLGSADTKVGRTVFGLEPNRHRTSPSVRVAKSYRKSGHRTSFQEISSSKEGANPICRRQSTLTLVSPSRGTVFEEYKLAYPQFRHDRSKFIMACSYIKWLRDNRKVMPLHQSLFDDFIKVFCGPYSEYVREQSASELPTETPVDFYNRFLEPEFTNRIVNLATLGEALESNADLAAKHSKRLRRISSRFVPLSVTTTPEQQEQPHSAVSAIRPLCQAPVGIGASADHELDHHRRVRISSPILDQALLMETTHKEATLRAEPLIGSRHNHMKKLQESGSKAAAIFTPTSLNFTTPKLAHVGKVVILDQKGTPTHIYIPCDDMEANLLPTDAPKRRGRNRYSLLPGQSFRE